MVQQCALVTMYHAFTTSTNTATGTTASTKDRNDDDANIASITTPQYMYDSHECDWDDMGDTDSAISIIECDYNGRVIGLRLGGDCWQEMDQRIVPPRATIPSAISLLNSLQQFEIRYIRPEYTNTNLSDNDNDTRMSLNEFLPESLERIESIRILGVYHMPNILGGSTIPADRLVRLSNLQAQYMAGDQFIGTLAWDILLNRSKLPELSILDLNINNLSGTLPSSPQLLKQSGIAYLTLGQSGFSGQLPTELGLWTSLTYLGLNNNNLE